MEVFVWAFLERGRGGWVRGEWVVFYWLIGSLALCGMEGLGKAVGCMMMYSQVMFQCPDYMYCKAYVGLLVWRSYMSATRLNLHTVFKGTASCPCFWKKLKQVDPNFQHRRYMLCFCAIRFPPKNHPNGKKSRNIATRSSSLLNCTNSFCSFSSQSASAAFSALERYLSS